ncbi:MAG: NUDIX hydrolase, partial [Chloroflexota bacterium]|nr:NUDIX hydrolase [Chloroflexota bacterium]
MSTEATPADGIPHTVSALIRREGTILLVQEQAAGDAAPTWMLPGGQVERDETLEGALRREIREETGLGITGAPSPAFAVEIEASLEDLAGTWRAVTYACNTEGDVAPADPDGLILSAEWVPIDDAFQHLEQVEWYDSGPLRAFLSGDAPSGSRYRYRLQGRRGAVVRSVVEVVEDA